MDKNLDYYMSLPYAVKLTPNEDGYWFAEIPLLDGCTTNGKDAPDALLMIKDAQRAWLISALEMGIPIPEPNQKS